VEKIVKMPGKKNTPHLPRNYEVAPGVMRFSKARMYAKRGVWAKKPFKAVKKTVAAKPKFVVKKVGGDKNGGERKVQANKGPKLLGEYRKRKSVAFRNGKSKKAMGLRPTIVPGTVLIILAGRHKGKRVVFLKQLSKSGLLLVTGPMKLNSCPLRRIAQAYVIATKTHIDIGGVSVPSHCDDAYFRRTNAKKQPKKEADADLFATGKSEYVVSDQRKADQKQVDKAILGAIRKHPDHHTLFGYLGSRFSIGKNQYPHKMIF
jgi:large subunit ribosomal protein L6e